MGSPLRYVDHSGLARLAEQSRIKISKRAKWEVLGNSGRVSYTFIAMQTSTYVRPHCHPNSFLVGPSGSHFLVVLNGRIALILIDPKTGIMKKTVLSAIGGARAVEIPGNVYHSAVALTPNTLILEIFEPGRKVKTLNGSPKPGSPEARKLVALWTKAPNAAFRSTLLKSA